MDIRGGFIRQRTNGNVSIFEIDITPIVGDINIAIIDLKNKLDLLKMFQGQEVTIEITESTPGDPGNFVFSDQFSSLRVVLPSPDFVDNKFMREEELRSIFNSSGELQTEFRQLQQLLISKQLELILTEIQQRLQQLLNQEINLLNLYLVLKQILNWRNLQHMYQLFHFQSIMTLMLNLKCIKIQIKMFH